MFVLNPYLRFHTLQPGQASGPVPAPATPDTPGQQAAAPVAPSIPTTAAPAAPVLAQPAVVVDPTNPQATPANPTGAAPTPPNPADIVTPPPAGASPAGGQQPPWGDRPEDFNPDQAWQLIQNLRGDVAQASQRAEQQATQAAQTAAQQATQAMAQQIGQALGLVAPNQPADPAQLLQQAEAQNQQYAQQLRTLQEDSAVRAASSAPGVGANADLLLPYLRGTGALTSLDPNAPDYPAQVAGVIQGLLVQYPQFRQVQVAPASGAPAVTPTGTPAPVVKGIEEHRAEIRKNHSQRI
jgi:hypothetical protein